MFQPLLTSAFASYTVRKPPYIDYRSETQNAADKGLAGVAASDRSTAVKSTEETQKAESARDDGKPRSPSGDVLELSESAQLTPEEQEQVTKLKARDTEVRVHEQAHLAAAGPYATGGPTFTFQTGPDGKHYAIGGEVGIDTSEVSGDPQATIQKMQTIVSAALAPAEPSGQDMSVAAAARQKEAQARTELAEQQQEPLDGSEETEESGQIANEEQTAESAKSGESKFGAGAFRAAYRSHSSIGSSAASAARFSAFV